MINRIAGVPLKRGQPGQEEQGRSSFALPDFARYVQPVENLITNNPAAAVAAAFCVGVALAWWIKRSK